MTFEAGSVPQYRESELLQVLSPNTIKLSPVLVNTVFWSGNNGARLGYKLPGKMAFARGRGGIKAVHIFEMRGGLIQPFPINDHVPVIANLHPLIRQDGKALDVELILFLNFRARRGEHDYLPALRLAKIIRHPVHKQMVARAHAHFEDVLALVIDMPGIKHEMIGLIQCTIL